MPGWLAVGASLLTLILAAERVEAKPESRHDGRITFIIGESGETGPSPRLVVMDADGKNARVRLGYVVRASLAPDGRSIAYEGLGSQDTRVIAADGPLQDRLLVRNGVNADWSPTGEAIAFVRGRDIWIRDLRTRSERRVVRHANAFDLDWSPDGKRLAFDQLSFGGNDVWVMELATKRVHRLIRGGKGRSAANPRWSPDRHRIAFERGRLPNPNGGQYPFYIYIARADGTAERRVAEDESPAWSPDSRELAISEFRRVSRIRLNGTHRRVVYAHCCAVRDLDWVR